MLCATRRKIKISTTSVSIPPTPKKLIAMKNAMKRLLNKKLKSGPRRRSKMATLLRRKKLRMARLVKRKISARRDPKLNRRKTPLLNKRKMAM